jgi:PTH1 family peptidyl-tRNA hydrolase
MDFVRSLLGRRPAGDEATGPLKMIVGLGNPGAEHAANRHNVGFQAADLFAARHGLKFDKVQKRARTALGRVQLPAGWSGRVLLVKPLTYMNASGEAVGPLARFYKVAPADLLVIFDDLDLPVGRIRLRPGGGSSGQKGVKSVIQSLGAEEFPRVRVGIGRPPGQMDPAAYVLQPFSADQEAEMALVRPRVVEAIEEWLAQGITAAMNQFNAGS